MISYPPCIVIADRPSHIVRPGHLFRLEGHEVVEERELYRWGFWMETADRVVKQESVGSVHVSTVFLGIAYEDGKVFETAVFEGEGLVRTQRCRTWDEAELQHDQIVEELA